MKYEENLDWVLNSGRSPCGERGLKYYDASRKLAFTAVAPRAGSVG